MIDKLKKQKIKKTSKVEYWKNLPIIVNGIAAWNFFHNGLVLNNNNINKR